MVFVVLLAVTENWVCPLVVVSVGDGDDMIMRVLVFLTDRDDGHLASLW